MKARAQEVAGTLRRVLPTPAATPFTFWYLVLLALTTAVLRLVSPTVMHHLLALSSTDAANLQHHAVRVLLLSAIWLPDADWLPYAVIFTAVLAPLERRMGTGATLAVFASGHVLASLATELPVLWAVRSHLLPRVDAHLIDVGVSYGFCAAAGVLLLLLASPARWWAAGALGIAIAALYLGADPASTDSVVTVAGHLLSVTVGALGWLPTLRRRGLLGSLRPRLARATVPEPVPATS